jgi:hypothetical protein
VQATGLAGGFDLVDLCPAAKRLSEMMNKRVMIINDEVGMSICVKIA